MKQHDVEILIMEYLEGKHPVNMDESMTREAEELARIQMQIKDLPLEFLKPETDRGFYDYLEEIRDQKKVRNLLPSNLWPFVLAAASLAILIYFFYPKSIAVQYEKLTSNTDKINFIYALNKKQQLSAIETDWLRNVLNEESNPNVKVTLLDLIENRSYPMAESLSVQLLNEDIPSVQMAVLNTLEKSTNTIIKNNLAQFQERDDLEAMVRIRTKELINLK